jgi:hypothetical protein
LPRLAPFGEESQPGGDPQQQRKECYEFLYEPQPQRHAGHFLHFVAAEFMQAPFDLGAAQPCHGALQARDRFERRQLVDPHGHVDVRDCSLFPLQRDRLPETGSLVNAMVQPTDLSIRLNSRNTRTVASNHNDEHRTVKISSPPASTDSLPLKICATPSDCLS